jgi:alpha-galactosidase
VVRDSLIRLKFDAAMRCQIDYLGNAEAAILCGPSTSEYLDTADGRIEQFALDAHSVSPISDPLLGSGTEYTLTGLAKERWRKQVRIRQFYRYPGLAIYRVTYTNLAAQDRELHGWTNHAFHVKPSGTQQPAFWSYSGSTYEDRRDWVLPVNKDFAQDNFLGMSASDYGGGMPIVDVWRRDAGLAIGHLERVPKLISMPVKESGGHAQVRLSAALKRKVAPGDTVETLETFVAVHRGDHYAVLDAYRRIMADRGLHTPTPPAAAYEPIWCAWGYERDCTVALVEGTLPKVKELGLKWAVIDDGWQSNVGDWRLDRDKFPRGEADMKDLVGKIRAADLKPRLWFAPLALAPGSDALHEHTDMLLLDKEGAPQLVSWWNSLYICPAYARTVDYTSALVKQFLGDWGFDGLKIDGQHLNGVAPCYNPKHRHARPEESVEALPQFFASIYAAARAVKSDALIELCPCGTTYSVFDFPYINQMPASDPESSWQVRLKGKTLKALYGPSAPYAGDHVELSDNGDDFASTIGVGAVVSTKFTWPQDPKPKDSFLLTPQREKQWRKWLEIYQAKMLPKGIYRGDLYDIGFDEPEAHAIEREGRLYYAFYADRWNGMLELRGLKAARYKLHDYVNDQDLGTASPSSNTLMAKFEHCLLIEATPA